MSLSEEDEESELSRCLVQTGSDIVIVDSQKLITFYQKTICPNKLLKPIGTESRTAIKRKRVMFDRI